MRVIQTAMATRAECMVETNEMSEKWQAVKEVFADALRHQPEERVGFLDRACSDDPEVRREVESLLASYEYADGFLETPAIAVSMGINLTGDVKFTAGHMLGHYEIRKHIGTGGMGEVYLAEDKTLGRPVALKTLRDDKARKNQAWQRFLREARVAAKLDHPNICPIYEISESGDCSFIVMQYVEGETLGHILDSGRLSVGDSMKFAVQIADALEEAHSQQIIHRDIKPSNVVVNNKGQLKVLDFGLAKFVGSEPNRETAKRLSTSGAIMGTVPYMSPEQLRGKKLDVRTDIFSFGVVFYEMLSGISPFQYDSNAESISAILTEEPDWTKIPSEVLPIVRKSLMKDLENRYQTVAELAADLRNTNVVPEKKNENSWTRRFSLRSAKQNTSTPRYYSWQSLGLRDAVTAKIKEISGETNEKLGSSKVGSNHLLILTAGFVFLAILGIAVWFAWVSAKPKPSHAYDSLRSVRLVSWKSGSSSPYTDFRVSNDDKMLVYSSTQDGDNEGIFIKQTTDGEDFRVTKDELSNHSPVWSPDNQRIAFASFRDGQSGIYVCPSLGGQTTLLKIVGDGYLSLRHWTRDGSGIFFETKGNLFRFDIATGEISPVTELQWEHREARDFSISPNEDEIVYTDTIDGQSDLWIASINGGVPTRLTNDTAGELQPRWHPDNKRILYTAFRNNHYQINLVRRDGSAPEQVTRGESDYELIDISSDGTSIFYRSSEARSDIWAANVEDGEESEVATGSDVEYWPEISPDGKSILFQTNFGRSRVASTSELSVVIRPLTSQMPTRVLNGYNPHWLPDSRHIAFLRFNEIEQKYSLWTADALNGEEKLIAYDSVQQPSYAILPNNRGEIGEFDWSRVVARLAYLVVTSNVSNLLIAAPGSDQQLEVTKNDDLNVSYSAPRWSPDGSQLAFVRFHASVPSGAIGESSLWVTKEGKAREINKTEESLRLLGWTGNGDLIFETCDGPMKSSPGSIALFKISVNGGKHLIANFKNIYPTSMTLAEDGRAVAFISRQEGKDDVFTASIVTGESKKITSNKGARLYFGSPAWSADGKRVFFDKQEELNTISIFENFE